MHINRTFPAMHLNQPRFAVEDGVPYVSGVGSIVGSTTSITVPVPVHVPGDIIFLIVNDTDVGPMHTVNDPEYVSLGFRFDGGLNQGFTQYAKRVQTINDPAPVVTNTGDHVTCLTYAVRGACDLGLNSNGTGEWLQGIANSGTGLSGAKTMTIPQANVLPAGRAQLGVMVWVAQDDSAAAFISGVANANVSINAEHADGGNTAGSGSQIALYSMVIPNADPMGSLAWTSASAFVAGRLNVIRGQI